MLGIGDHNRPDQAITISGIRTLSINQALIREVDPIVRTVFSHS